MCTFHNRTDPEAATQPAGPGKVQSERARHTLHPPQLRPGPGSSLAPSPGQNAQDTPKLSLHVGEQPCQACQPVGRRLPAAISKATAGSDRGSRC